MSPMKLLRQQLACLALLAAWAPLADANVFGDAWECAQGSAQAGYELAGKGAGALLVLGKSPQCVAYATAGDVPLYATTGALFTLNAIDSSIVSSSNCVQSVKKNAVVPMGKLLNGALPGGLIPQDVLDAGSQEAADQLWEFMATAPPPLSTAIERIDCGCSFLEAGVSVQNVVEIFTIIAQAGEKCDAALSNVPGYQTVKKGVKAGATAMNNLGEDIFTDQVQHKDVEDYYFHDFDGGVDSYATRSHAAARILDPGHDWRNQEGASFLSETVVKLGGGANNGEQYKNTCKQYFDSHKMSADNAEEVCEAMVQRFDADYKSMVAQMKGEDALVKQLGPKLAARSQQAVAECGQVFPPQGAAITKYGYDGIGPTVQAHNHCADAMKSAVGALQWKSPYNMVGGLGFPVDPADVDAMLAAGKPYYFMHPNSMFGAHKIAWQAFENNGGDTAAAVAQGLLAYEMMHDKALKDSHKIHEKALTQAAEAQAKKVKDAAGQAFPHCPAGAGNAECLAALGLAVDVCLVQASSVPIAGEFPKGAEADKIAAIENKCASGYVALADAHAARKSLESSMRQNLLATCPGGAEPTRLNCMEDLQAAIGSCQGGLPQLTSGYFASSKFAQDPTPQVDCKMASYLFRDKWTADDEQVARINGAYSDAAKECIAKVPDFGGCQQEVGALADSCRTQLQLSANILLGSLALQSDALADAKAAIAKNGSSCVAQMMSVPHRMGAGKEAEVLMLSQYGPRCGRNQACKDLLGATLRQCQGLPAASGAGRPTAATGRQSAEARMQSRNNRIASSRNAVTAVMNNPAPFAFDKNALPQLAKSPASEVAGCKDELEAALAKFDFSHLASVGATPAPGPVAKPVLTPINNGGVVGPIRTPVRTPVQTGGGRPPPRVLEPAGPVAPVGDTRRPIRIPGGTTVTLQPGTDRMGGDFRGFAMPQPDPQQCRQACADDRACRAYTYVNPGLKGPQAMCFLKNSTPPATASGCCTSGQKIEAIRPDLGGAIRN